LPAIANRDCIRERASCKCDCEAGEPQREAASAALEGWALSWRLPSQT